jgi:hypothetical protein
LNKKGSYTHYPVFLSEAEGSLGRPAGFDVAEVNGESTAGFISNKLKFVNNPFGAASLCLLPWMACMQILQEQKSFLVHIASQAQYVNLGALTLENPPSRRLNKKGPSTHQTFIPSEFEGSLGWVSALEDWEQY